MAKKKAESVPEPIAETAPEPAAGPTSHPILGGPSQVDLNPAFS